MWIPQFSSKSEFLSYDWDTLVDHCVGRLVLAIARGNFRDEVVYVMAMAVAWTGKNAINK